MYDHLGFFHYQTTCFVRMMYGKHNLHTEKLAEYDHLGLFHYQTTYFVRMMYCKHNLHTEKLAGSENKQAGRRLLGRIGKERGGNWVRMNTTQEEIPQRWHSSWSLCYCHTAVHTNVTVIGDNCH